jgi:hypothetical protein
MQIIKICSRGDDHVALLHMAGLENSECIWKIQRKPEVAVSVSLTKIPDRKWLYPIQWLKFSLSHARWLFLSNWNKCLCCPSRIWFKSYPRVSHILLSCTFYGVWLFFSSLSTVLLIRESTLYFLKVNKYWHDRKRWEKESNTVKGAGFIFVESITSC